MPDTTPTIQYSFGYRLITNSAAGTNVVGALAGTFQVRLKYLRVTNITPNTITYNLAMLLPVAGRFDFVCNQPLSPFQNTDVVTYANPLLIAGSGGSGTTDAQLNFSTNATNAAVVYGVYDYIPLTV